MSKKSGIIQGIDIDGIPYLLCERPTLLWRIFNRILRRPDRNLCTTITAMTLDHWQVIGIALEDGKILFQPTYSADNDVEITVSFEEDG